MHDVLLVGAGPAGLALAAALVERGVDVALIAPELDTPPRWVPTYCAWEDELTEVGYGDFVDRRWGGAVAILGGTPRVLDRAYVRVDKVRLATHLHERARGATRHAGRVRGVSHTPTHSEVGTTTATGEGSVAARVVIDTSGHSGALLRPPLRPAPAFQTAIGRFVSSERSPWPADRAVLMDYSPVGDDAGPPTFLYVLPLADGRTFVEETVLAARPALPAEILRDRLERRLAAMGVVAEPGEEEWVSIPMGGALPSDPRVLGFGAAAGMIHPATGYLLPRVLGAADRVADAVATHLDGGPAVAVAAGREALWPTDRRQRRALYRFGLEALLGMDPQTTRAFFDAFFELPASDWSGYLSDRHSAAALRRVMWTLFTRVSPGLKWGLARGAFGAEGLALALAFVR